MSYEIRVKLNKNKSKILQKVSSPVFADYLLFAVK